MPRFERYIGIDYSGAQGPQVPLAGIKAFEARANQAPQLLPPPQGPNWSRQALAESLVELLDESAVPTLVGIDHGFSLPARLVGDAWEPFLVDFRETWQTHEHSVQSRRAECEEAYRGNDLRLTEKWTSSAQSVLLLDGTGRVGKATFAGLPWLLYLREQLPGVLHFWPFDGFGPASGRSVVAEVYPSLFRKRYQRQQGMNDHAHDAYSVCRWLQSMDQAGHLDRYFHPPLTEEERALASREGWILGVA